MKYCFVFVCQRGELEIKALLLAASLRRHLKCEHELVAAFPGPAALWGAPSKETSASLADLGVKTLPIVNPIGPDYPIGNKLACLGIPTSADKVVFLDSDMLCLRDFEGDRRFAAHVVNAKAADLATFGSQPGRWEAAYASIGLEVPSDRVPASVSGEFMPPYFNAGFIAAHRNCGLAAEWPAVARRLDGDPNVPDKRPWLDQVALPVALARLGIRVDVLDERYNFPAHLKPLDDSDLPWFCHYHWPHVVRREPVLNAEVGELVARHPALRAALDSHPDWARILQPYAIPNRPRPARIAMPELIITGVPRSGTSYLCRLIHEVPDCVVINEPPEIFVPLAEQPIPWGVALRYREVRRDVLDGQPIANKLYHGEFIEDTAVIDNIETYSPRVDRADFLLGTKNTLAYLARIPGLRKALPGALIVACVRHPIDTIASWKSTFAHLAAGDLEGQMLGHSRDRLLTEAQRERLAQVAATPSQAKRRALLWNHLALLVLESRAQLMLLRYEDVVADPASSLREVYASIPRMFEKVRMPAMRPSSARSKRSVLDAEDLHEIAATCAATAAQLGYSIG